MDEFLKKLRSKLRTESIIRSVIFATVIASAVSTVVSLAVWLSPVKASVLWIAVGLFLGLIAVVSPLAYFFKYKPSELDLARRVDRLGLEERMITRAELAAEGSPEMKDIASLQAASTDVALKALAASGNAAAGFISITASAAIALSVSLVPVGGMMTVGALADRHFIPTGFEIIDKITNPVTEKFYTVNYRVAYLDMDTGGYVLDEGGVIEGDDEQLVAYTVDKNNEVIMTSAATPVLAVEEDDYVFVCWDMDTAQTDPYRLDTEFLPQGDNYEYDDDGNIIIVHTAFFTLLPDGEGGGGGGGEEGDDQQQEGDQPSDAPDGDQSESNGSSGGSSDNGSDSDGSGGNYNPDKDNIIDGTQNYRELYQQYYDEAMEILASGGEIPEYYKKIIRDYFGVIV